MVKNERADKLYREAIVSGVELGQEKWVGRELKGLDRNEESGNHKAGGSLSSPNWALIRDILIRS